MQVSQDMLKDGLTRVLRIADGLDEDRLSAEDRANVAVSHLVETREVDWALPQQRAILTEAVKAIRDRTTGVSPAAVARAVPTQTTRAPADYSGAVAGNGAFDLLALTDEVLKALSDRLDFSDLAAQPPAAQSRALRSQIERLSEERRMHLNGREIADLVQAVLAEMLGLGPLEPLLADESVTDVMVNGPAKVYVERGGKLELTPVRFRDNAHVLSVAARIVAAVGRRIDESQPMVDARLKDGSRVNIAIPPLAIDGPTITIRKFPSAPVQLDRLVEGGSMSAQMAAFLGLASYLRLNVLVSGGTGSGKTTLMNAMSQFIPPTERIVTIEDAAELRFQQPHVVRFETRPPNVEGTGEVTMRTLVRNALRMRPDRIIIGEVRGDEVLDLMQAMNTGHDGSMTTLHANSAREALTRVESMAALAGVDPGTGVVRRQLVDAVNLIVQVSRMRDGKRRITAISEVAGIAGEAITLQDLFVFRTDPNSTRTEVKGQFVHTGYRPKFATRAADYGVLEDLDAILGI